MEQMHHDIMTLNAIDEQAHAYGIFVWNGQSKVGYDTVHLSFSIFVIINCNDNEYNILLKFTSI